MLVNICMKFHEGILERFLSYRADTTISQNLLFSISKGHNSNNTQSRVVFELQSRHDFVTDRRTDGQTDGQTARAKTICLPTLRGET